MKTNITATKTLISSILILGLIVFAGGAIGIINGQLDGNQHPYVGAVNNGVNFCSGALISPTVFVTAAHCFFYDGEAVWVTFDPETDGPGPNPEMMYSGIWRPHPDFCLDCRPGLPGSDTHDVAVVVLDEPVDVDRYAELPGEGLVDTLLMRTEVTLVGYGVQYFATGGGPPVPVALFDRYFASAELIASNHKHSDEFIKLTANPSKGKGTDCYGDSGGPNLLSGTDTIIAITSYGANPMCRGVGYSNRIDTEYALEFIESFLP